MHTAMPNVHWNCAVWFCFWIMQSNPCRVNVVVRMCSLFVVLIRCMPRRLPVLAHYALQVVPNKQEGICICRRLGGESNLEIVWFCSCVRAYARFVGVGETQRKRMSPPFPFSLMAPRRFPFSLMASGRFPFPLSGDVSLSASKWNRSELGVKPTWNGIELEETSKWNRNDCKVKSKWNRS